MHLSFYALFDVITSELAGFRVLSDRKIYNPLPIKEAGGGPGGGVDRPTYHHIGLGRQPWNPGNNSEKQKEE